MAEETEVVRTNIPFVTTHFDTTGLTPLSTPSSELGRAVAYSAEKVQENQEANEAVAEQPFTADQVTADPSGIGAPVETEEDEKPKRSSRKSKSSSKEESAEESTDDSQEEATKDDSAKESEGK